MAGYVRIADLPDDGITVVPDMDAMFAKAAAEGPAFVPPLSRSRRRGGLGDVVPQANVQRGLREPVMDLVVLPFVVGFFGAFAVSKARCWLSS